ncbi:MAG: hypothetical protein R3A12_03030 [Ignavibacteria bacterium]
MDVHLQKWVLSIFTKEFEMETKSFPASVEIVSNITSIIRCRLLRVHAKQDIADTKVQVVSAGINNIIINPCDVPTTDKEKKRKRDPVDSRKLGRSLRNNELKRIYVPDKKQQKTGCWSGVVMIW